MLKTHHVIAAELRISPKWVMAMLVISGLILTLLSDMQTDLGYQVQIRLFGLLLYVGATITWLLDRRNFELGRWFMLILLIALIFLGFNQLKVPEILFLLILPPTLAAVLISLPAALITAIGETVLLLLLSYTMIGLNPVSTVIALIGIWGVFGLMLALYQSIHHNITPVWEHFQHAQNALTEAHTRKVELEQALDDLAHANRELTMLSEKLAAMRLVAEEAQKTKGTFVAKVSHEFRTPLNMIIGLTDLLMSKPAIYGGQLSPALLEDLSIVHRNCDHLSKMINDVLDLSRIEMGHLTLHQEWVNLAECVDSALTIVRPMLEKKKLELSLIIPDDLPSVYCDQTRIRQVILNLVSNAVRFTDRGKITVQALSQYHHVVVSVADTGPGILPKDANIIFEPFYQGASDLWRDQGGSGLGLSICKQFVELHNGEIWLESEPGSGTTFFFRLPISPPMPPQARPGRWISENRIRLERSSKSKVSPLPLKQRILICDEAGHLYPSLNPYAAEIEFIDTRNPDQAAQELRTKTADMVMLNSDSVDNLWALLKQLDTAIPDTPIIAGSFASQINQALKADVVDYLVKPVTRTDLVKAIAAVDRPVKKILIVDDDPDLQLLITRMLTTEENAFEVTVASNGLQALDELRCQPSDLILMDIAMPNLDGWQMLELKNQDEALRDIPVIIISAQDVVNQPPTSPVLLATIGSGLSLSKFLSCSLELSTLMLHPADSLI